MTAPRRASHASRSLQRGYTRRAFIKAGSAAGMLLMAGCQAAPNVATATGTADPNAVNPGKLSWLVGDLSNERFDVGLVPAGTGDTYARQMHAFLTTLDIKDGGLVTSPGIASKWSVSADGKTWSFTVRKGVKFHDGSDLTVEDVLWTLQHQFGKQAAEYVINSAIKSTGAQVAKIAQTGPDEVSVTTTIPGFDFFAAMSEANSTWQSAIMPKRATLRDVTAETNYDLNPIGAGPMKLVSQVRGTSMTFERFADYYIQPKNGFSTDKRPNFKTLELRIVPDEATRVAALRAGQADIAAVSARAKEQVEAGGGRLVFSPEGAFIQGLMYGAWKPQYPISDKRVRQALNYAIDRETMRQKLFGSETMTIKGWTFVTPSAIGYTPALDPDPFDPNRARQLLADAGYPGGKGFGRLILNTIQSTTPYLPESAQLVAQTWKKELGLDVEVRLGDVTALKAQSTAGQLDGQIYWTDNSTRQDPTTILRAYYGDPARLDRRHDSAELFALYKSATAVIEPTAREAALAKLFVRLRDEAHQLNVGFLNTAFGIGPRILKWTPAPLANWPNALHTITLKSGK